MSNFMDQVQSAGQMGPTQKPKNRFIDQVLMKQALQKQAALASFMPQGPDQTEMLPASPGMGMGK